MSTYQFKGAGHALPAVGGGACRLQRRIDIPAMIALGINSGLALVAAPNDPVALAATGFGASDILEVFWVPKGTIVKEVGLYVITGEGATCTIDVGVTSATECGALAADTDGWLNNANLETAGYRISTTDATLTMGRDTVPGGEIFVTNGSIDILFNNAATNVAIFQIWAEVRWIDID
jgi:hypothetical protein